MKTSGAAILFLLGLFTICSCFPLESNGCVNMLPRSGGDNLTLIENKKTGIFLLAGQCLTGSIWWPANSYTSLIIKRTDTRPFSLCFVSIGQPNLTKAIAEVTGGIHNQLNRTVSRENPVCIDSINGQAAMRVDADFIAYFKIMDYTVSYQ